MRLEASQRSFRRAKHLPLLAAGYLAGTNPRLPYALPLWQYRRHAADIVSCRREWDLRDEPRACTKDCVLRVAIPNWKSCCECPTYDIYLSGHVADINT